MSLTNSAQNNSALVPTVTGNPAADTLIRNAIISVSAMITGIIVAWMNAHGFDHRAMPEISLLITGAVASTLTAIAAIAWGWWQTHQSTKAIVNNTIAAAMTGQVPAAIMAKATEEQARAVEASPVATVTPTLPVK